MGKIVEPRIRQFDLGITNDAHEKNTRYATLIKSFDGHSFPSKLVPFRSSESGDNNASTSQKQNFCVAIRTGTTYNLFSLGVISGTARAEVLCKALSSGGSADLGDNTWTTPNNNQSSAGSTNFELFVYYPKTGYIYGARAGSQIWRFDPTSSGAWVDSHQALSYTHIAQGLVHSKDDILYIPYDNKIATNNNGSWNTTALTAIPSKYYITSISEYGNYLAIACAPLSGYGNSKVFLWDRDTSLNTISESIDWGQGNIKILEEINGYLIGISVSSNNSFNDIVTFRQYSGGVATIFKQLNSETTNTGGGITSIVKQKVNQNLYFLMSITLGGTAHQGLWKIGRPSPGLPFTVTMDRTPNNDTALSSGTLYGFIIVGDYVFISYDSASTFALSKTDDIANYNVSATYETIKFGTPDKHYKLLTAGVMTDAMPTAGQIIFKYKKDEETSWTTIYTDGTDNSLFHEATLIESDGSQLPEFHEIQFQILSTGGAVVTGLYFKYEEIPDGLTD